MLTVLIIEDEAKLLQNMAQFLMSFEGEFHVLTAPSGEEGISILEAGTPVDVLLTDVRLPGIDGIEVVRRTLNEWPEIRIIVMTAFGSQELRNRAECEGALRFIEKPVDLDTLPASIREVHGHRQRRSHEVGGLDILEVSQFVSLSRDTKVVRFNTRHGQGTLVFENGHLVHCSTEHLGGPEAFFQMALWGDGSFWELFDIDTRRFTENVDLTTGDLFDQAAQLSAIGVSDEDTAPEPPKGQSPPRTVDTRVPHTPPGLEAAEVTRPKARGKRKENGQMAIKDFLAEFEEIEGFKGSAVFTAQGEMLEGISKGKLDIKTIGMFANNALLNAQKATDQMGLGRGNLMQIRAPQAVVLMRCLNEATDFAATKEGKAHFHTVVVLDPEGNTGMAAMVLDRIQAKIAEEVR